MSAESSESRSAKERMIDGLVTAELVLDLLGPVAPPVPPPMPATTPAAPQSQLVYPPTSVDLSDLVDQLADTQERIWEQTRARAMRLAEDLRDPDEVIPDPERKR